MKKKMTSAEIEKLFQESKTTEEYLNSLWHRATSDEVEDMVISRIARDIMEKTERLKDMAGSIERRMALISKLLSEKHHGTAVNSLGELQDSGQFDIRCALYYEAFQRLGTEISDRKYQEQKEARQEKLSELHSRNSMSMLMLIGSLRNLGDSTLKQLVKDLPVRSNGQVVRTEGEVLADLETLMNLGFVRQIGKYFRFSS